MRQQKKFWLDSLLLSFSIAAIMMLSEYLFPTIHLVFKILFVMLTILAYRLMIYKQLKGRLKRLYDALSAHSEKATNHPLSFSFDEVFFHNLDVLEQHVLSLFDKTHHLKNDQADLVLELERLAEVRDAMFEISSHMLVTDDDDELYTRILENAIKSVKNATHGSLAKLGDHNVMRFLSVKGYNDTIKNTPIDLKKTFLWIEEKGQIESSVVINDIVAFNKLNFSEAEFSRFVSAHPVDIQSAISSPIIIDGKLYGMINVDSGLKNAFKQRDVAIMEYFSKQVAILFKNRALLKQSNYFARYDTLTGVYNRNYFEEVFANHIKKSLRYNENFSLIKLDVSDLKGINENFGQGAGDYLLKRTAQLLKLQIRDSDLLARFSGDQFIIVFFGSDLEASTRKIDRIIDTLHHEDILYKDHQLPLHLFSGLVHCPSEAKTYDDLLRIIDERLRLAKNKQKY